MEHKEKPTGCCAERSTWFMKFQKASQGDRHGPDTKRILLLLLDGHHHPLWAADAPEEMDSTWRSYCGAGMSMSLELYRILVGVGCCNLVGGGVGVGGLVRSEGRGVVLLTSQHASRVLLEADSFLTSSGAQGQLGHCTCHKARMPPSPLERPLAT